MESSYLYPTHLQGELAADYVDESHIGAYAQALRADDLSEIPEAPSPGILTPGSGSHHNSRIRKVSALSDFAPVNLKVHKRRKGRKSSDRRSDWLFLILRWPLLFFIFAFISAEFSLYVLIRQLVNTKEWLSAWRGRKGLLRKRLRAARTYQEWKEAAETMDEYLEFNEWKKQDEDPFYDWRLVRKVKRSLKNLREKKDARGVLGVLETCIRTNFAGVESSRLYSETFFGTKDLIEAYLDEQVKALKFVRDSPDLSIEEKKRFFKSANTNLGTSALCLSGGASFGYYHFGVVKAFFDEGLLPRVITGTSAGGLIAALICTRTDDELRELLVPEIAHRVTACEEPIRIWLKRFWKTGARFDPILWAKKCSFFTRGSLTFREAYLRTGRILNISVIPADRHSPTKLLNYVTAPDTIIWSALLASAAVPGILPPVVLMQKLRDGTVVPWNWGSRFKDGSLRVDIPIQALNLYFNVTHPVVSQVNPHVHLFFFAPRGSAGKPVAHRKGKGWRGNFLLSAAEQWLKLELTKNFKVIRDLELLPLLLGQDWSSVFLQRFDGAVTIWPRTRFWDWTRLLTDPDPAELTRMMHVGQIVTWPKLHMINNRFRIEKEILVGRQFVRKSLRGRPLERQIPVATDDAAGHDGGISVHVSKSPEQTELPLSPDTDAEHAYVEQTHKRNGERSSSTTPSRSTSVGQDFLRAATRRRKTPNVASLFERDNQPGSSRLHDRSLPSPDPTPAPSQSDLHVPVSSEGHESRNATHSPSNFFSRLRVQSMTALSSPFNSFSRRSASNDITADGDTWSSDSSSDDDFDLEELRHQVHSSGAFMRASKWDERFHQDGDESDGQT